MIIILLVLGILAAGYLYLKEKSQSTPTVSIKGLKNKITSEVKDCVIRKLGAESAKRLADQIRRTQKNF